MKTLEGDATRDVRAAFSLSYRALDPLARKAFRLLGLHLTTGNTVDPFVMGALLGNPAAEAVAVLERLEQRGLVAVVVDANHPPLSSELVYMAQRYRMHDLLRLYAGELVRRRRHRRERISALRRLTRAYYGCVNYAFDRQNNNNAMVDAEYVEKWITDPTGPASVDVAGSPTEWFDRERLNLLSATRAAAEARPRPEYTAKLAGSLFYFLEIGGHMTDWAAVERIAAEAAISRRNRHDLARSLRNRGRIALVRVLDSQDRLTDDGAVPEVDRTACQEAIALFQQSLRLYRRGRDQRDVAGEVTVLRELGDAYRLQFDPTAPDTDLITAAIEKYNEAAQIYSALDSENGLNSLGLALGVAHVLEDPEDPRGQAEALFERSREYGATEVNGRPRHGRLAAYSMIRLAQLRSRQGHPQDAVRHYQDAVTMLRSHATHDHITRARALALLGRALAESAAPKEVDPYLREALDIFTTRGPAYDSEAAVVTNWIACHGVGDH
jgi:tetratricopeptide (TPR) repeat protein